MILTALAPNGVPIRMDSDAFPLVTCHCTRCDAPLVIDERGPDPGAFADVCIAAAADHRCPKSN